MRRDVEVPIVRHVARIASRGRRRRAGNQCKTGRAAHRPPFLEASHELNFFPKCFFGVRSSKDGPVGPVIFVKARAWGQQRHLRDTRASEGNPCPTRTNRPCHTLLLAIGGGGARWSGASSTADVKYGQELAQVRSGPA